MAKKKKKKKDSSVGKLRDPYKIYLKIQEDPSYLFRG
jgi:hypothetical protein